MSELDYVSQTLAKAISTLASHPGRIAERMESAHVEWHPITVDKVPSDLRGDWQYVIDRLTVVEDDEKGHVPATIDSLSETDLSEIATHILSFADRISKRC
jgi:hypothetical protein